MLPKRLTDQTDRTLLPDLLHPRDQSAPELLTVLTPQTDQTVLAHLIDLIRRKLLTDLEDLTVLTLQTDLTHLEHLRLLIVLTVLIVPTVLLDPEMVLEVLEDPLALSVQIDPTLRMHRIDLKPRKDL